MDIRVIVLHIVVLLFCCACSVDEIRVDVLNYTNTNLNQRGDNVPVTVVVYKLNDIEKFSDASVEDLLKREDVVLGKDKIDSIKMQIAPDDSVVAMNIKESEVPYVGILVVYANLEKKRVKSYIKTSEIEEDSDIRLLQFGITSDGVYDLKFNKIEN